MYMGHTHNENPHGGHNLLFMSLKFDQSIRLTQFLSITVVAFNENILFSSEMWRFLLLLPVFLCIKEAQTFYGRGSYVGIQSVPFIAFIRDNNKYTRQKGIIVDRHLILTLKEICTL